MGNPLCHPQLFPSYFSSEIFSKFKIDLWLSSWLCLSSRFSNNILKKVKILIQKFSIIFAAFLSIVYRKRDLIYILSKSMYRKLIIQKARLKRLAETFLTLSWHNCPWYWRGVRAQSDFYIVCSQCSMSVYLKCVSRFFQWIRISNKEFVSNFALQMEFRVRNRWKCYRRLTVNRLYQKHVYMSGKVHSKAVEMWWKICLSLVGHQRPQLKLRSLKWRKWWLKIVI